MLDVLRHRTFRRLFTAQIVALIGTGLLTVALGLLAYDLAGSDAGAVLGTALAIKMLAYVGVAPIISALTHRVPRKVLLVSADVIRALIALALPFVDQTWQILRPDFSVASRHRRRSLRPFKSVIPSVLVEEEDYTRALSLSRLAYDLESLLSPILAAALLTLISYHSLFLGTVVGFTVSGLLVVGTTLAEAGSGGSGGAAGPANHARCPRDGGQSCSSRTARVELGGRPPRPGWSWSIPWSTSAISSAAPTPVSHSHSVSTVAVRCSLRCAYHEFSPRYLPGD